ncbi:pyridoxamine 5'-phosphate oxidase family protein [Devriesea agamarum]|uniref:pyridoxamine 5'-phosphate oxidase family protein n=1 Tax=Devriesea agamarum TaxID=472569 RepID=UPI00071CFA81|nr:pyridoxamine 5'-phosphate oxidase family protein [Devriesea agamarum]
MESTTQQGHTGPTPEAEKLSEEAIFEILGRHSFGRLAVATSYEPDIFPLNYALVGRTLLFKTAPGTKLVELTINANAAFEVDDVSAQGGWSIVVKGATRVLERDDDIERAAQVELPTWFPGEKHVFVELDIESLNGVRFTA